jgi:hypothetical protein
LMSGMKTRLHTAVFKLGYAYLQGYAETSYGVCKIEEKKFLDKH